LKFDLFILFLRHVTCIFVSQLFENQITKSDGAVSQTDFISIIIVVNLGIIIAIEFTFLTGSSFYNQINTAVSETEVFDNIQYCIRLYECLSQVCIFKFCAGCNKLHCIDSARPIILFADSPIP